MRVEKLLLTTQETADRLGIGRTAVYDLIRTKKLKTLKIGARRLVPIEALHEVVALLLEEAA
jgi:excisionase family DNA binding protein